LNEITNLHPIDELEEVIKGKDQDMAVNNREMAKMIGNTHLADMEEVSPPDIGNHTVVIMIMARKDQEGQEHAIIANKRGILPELVQNLKVKIIEAVITEIVATSHQEIIEVKEDLMAIIEMVKTIIKEAMIEMEAVKDLMAIIAEMKAVNPEEEANGHLVGIEMAAEIAQEVLLHAIIVKKLVIWLEIVLVKRRKDHQEASEIEIIMEVLVEDIGIIKIETVAEAIEIEMMEIQVGVEAAHPLGVTKEHKILGLIKIRSLPLEEEAGMMKVLPTKRQQPMEQMLGMVKIKKNLPKLLMIILIKDGVMMIKKILPLAVKNKINLI
jgi:hypothetical protein